MPPKTQWGKTFQREDPFEVPEDLFPGPGTYTPDTGDVSDGGNDADEDAIICAVCSSPWANHKARSTCPHCEYENFLGDP